MAAVAWWGKAAEQHHAGAQCCLAMCYANGEGVMQNPEVAVQWFVRAADLGDAAAQDFLGGYYARGKGVEQDDAQAVACWEKSASTGNACSQHSLGLCYMNGTHGLPKNTRRARSFLKAAAAQGVAEAIEDLKLLNTCESCGAPDANRTCGGCKTVKGIRVARYCTPECQKKLDCGGLKVCECRNCRVSDRVEGSTSAAATWTSDGSGRMQYLMRKCMTQDTHTRYLLTHCTYNAMHHSQHAADFLSAGATHLYEPY